MVQLAVVQSMQSLAVAYSTERGLGEDSLTKGQGKAEGKLATMPVLSMH